MQQTSYNVIHTTYIKITCIAVCLRETNLYPQDQSNGRRYKVDPKPATLLEGDYSAAGRIGVECNVRTLNIAHSRIINSTMREKIIRI